MFENLSSKLSAVVRNVRGLGRITEDNIGDSLRQARLALLEADVNVSVVKLFLDRVRQKAIGMEVIPGLTPGQQFVKVIHEELTELMGSQNRAIAIEKKGATVVMLVGLQGSGKTTTAGKLAKHFAKQGYAPYLVPADVRRPAAIEQLQRLAESLEVPFYDSLGMTDAVEVCKKSISSAARAGANIVIIDTAGRLHIDSELMDELKKIKAEVNPSETILVADAMTGQDSVAIASSFSDQIGVDGVILTKLDGDARGGAAISMLEVTGKPIIMAGMGENLDQLELFHPERMASRILGMGDILTLIEKAEEVVDEEAARRMERRMASASFNLEDFLEQLRQIQKLGSMEDILKLTPGMSGVDAGAMDSDSFKITESIICSMTIKERRNHTIMNGSRKRRVSAGSGTSVQEVNRLLKQFARMKKIMRKMGPKKLMKQLAGGGGMFGPQGGMGGRF